MSKVYKTGFVVTGDASGGVKAMQATRAEMDKLGTTQKKSKAQWAETAQSQRLAAAAAATSNNQFGALNATLKNTVGVLAGVAGATLAARSLKNFAAEGLANVDAQTKLARSVGATADGIRAVQIAAGDAGLDGMNESLVRLNRRLGAAEMGNKMYGASVDALGLNLESLRNMDVDERIAAISDAVKESGLSMDVTARHLQNLGFQQGNANAFFRQGGDVIRAATAEVSAYGLQLNSIDTDAVEKANDQWSRVALLSESLSNQLAVSLAPAMGAVAVQITGFAAALRGTLPEFAEINDLSETQVERLELAADAFYLLGDAAKAVAAIYAARLTLGVASSTTAFIAGQVEALRYQATLASMAGVSSRTAVALTAQAAAANVARLAMLALPHVAVAAGISAVVYALTQLNNQQKETARLANEARASIAAYNAEQNSVEGLQARLKAEQETLAAIQSTAAAHEAGTSQAAQSLEKLRSMLDSGDFSGDTLAGLKQNYENLKASMDSAGDKAEGSKQRIASLKEDLAALGVQATSTAEELGGFGQTAEQSEAIDKTITALAEQYLALEMGERSWLAYQLAQKGANDEQIQQALNIRDAAEALKASKAEEAEALKAAEKAQSDYASTLAKSASNSINSLDDVEKQSQRVWSALAAGKISTTQAAAAIDGLASAGASLVSEQQQWIDQMIDAMDPARALQEEITTLQEAFEDGLFGDLGEDKFNDYIDGLKKKLAELNDVKIQDPAVQLGSAMQTAAGGVKDVAGAMQGMYSEGERGYHNMAIAMQAANVAAAIGAVLQQGSGDPYTAFARMAAMAVAVTALGVQVSMMGGGFADDAAKQQAVQGTGTVLGDSAAKSESISKAIDVTAAATSELVGINRDMLRALQNLQTGISGASVRIAQGAKGVDFGATYKPVNAFDKASSFANSSAMNNPLMTYMTGGLNKVMGGVFKGVGKLLGGKSKVTDSGIQLIGGTLGNLMENVVVNAYQVTKSKKYRWSSSKTSVDYRRLGNDVSDQFSLVFESLADSVAAGATALGFSAAEVESQINRFRVGTQKISTKGLSAKEQQKEIEAVFSRIFDNLAGSVVRFLPKFQKAGEGLGETLARVATNVQVTEEAAYRLGFQANRLGAEQFAGLSVALIEAAGGLESFIGGMGNFIDKFAPEAHKIEIATTDMQRALSSVGLSVPKSRDAMWELMQTLDAGSASGRAQIATLLELSGVSDTYYKMLEERSQTLEGFLGDDGAQLSEYFQSLADWISAESRAIDTDYKARINLLENQARLSVQIGDYVAKLRLSDLSPAAPAEKLAQAGDEFASLLVRAQEGDLEAAAKLQGAADTYLKNADDYYGRSDIYTDIFEDVANQLEQLELSLGAESTEDHIASLNEQMLVEQQQLRDFAEQELNWAVSQYEKLENVEHLLSIMPGNLGSEFEKLLAGGKDAVAIIKPDRSAITKIDGSHAGGLRSVPFDGYRAELHKDERVLTASEAKEYNSNQSSNNSSLLPELQALRNEISQLRMEQSRSNAKAEQQRGEQTRATESVVRNTRATVKMT